MHDVEIVVGEEFVAAGLFEVGFDHHFDEFVECAEKWLRDNKVKFDQSIRESSKEAHWWHIGLRNSKGEQRKQFKALTK